jgi:hypothetical protein
MFKKVLLVALSSAYLFGSDFWQVDFHQGTSIYNIENSKKERLSFECGYSGGSILLYNKNQEITLKNDEAISFIINDEKKLLSAKAVSSTSGTASDNTAWGNLVFELPKAKKIIVEASNQKFVFEPSNLKELDNFISACLEYDDVENETQVNQDNNSNTSSNNQPPVSNKPPFKIDFKEVYNPYSNANMPKVVITSLNDKLVVNNVLLNKGKCQISLPLEFKKGLNWDDTMRSGKVKKFPISIPEFESLEIDYYPSCNLLRMEIATNLGTWTFGE